VIGARRGVTHQSRHLQHVEFFAGKHLSAEHLVRGRVHRPEEPVGFVELRVQVDLLGQAVSKFLLRAVVVRVLCFLNSPRYNSREVR
jgi:hypothetical protein